MTPEQATKAVLESLTSIDPEQYRMGHTKVIPSSPKLAFVHTLVQYSLNNDLLHSLLLLVLLLIL